MIVLIQRLSVYMLGLSFFLLLSFYMVEILIRPPISEKEGKEFKKTDVKETREAYRYFEV